MKILNLKSILSCSFLVTLSLLGSTPAFAAENSYSFTCRKPLTTPVEHIPTPYINLILDVSGSMWYKNGDDCTSADCYMLSPSQQESYGGSRLSTAIRSIYKLMETNKSERLAYFGFATFSTKYYQYETCNPYNRDTEQSIQHQLRLLKPTAQTYTEAAINKSLTYSHCFLNTEEGRKIPSATMIITDGAPNNPDQTLRAACEHKKRAPIYFVGLGSGSDSYYNSLVAAAGGTGYCQAGDPCSPENLRKLTDPRGIDPKDDSHQNYAMKAFKATCSGSFQANNTSELTKAIADITGSLSCKYPMQTNSKNVVQEDPTGQYDYLLVQPSGFSEPIPYEGSKKGKRVGPDNSYSFANGSRTEVILGKTVCKALRRGGSSTQKASTTVLTNYGCRCEETEGTECSVPNWQASNSCPIGTWKCNRATHTDYCEPASNKQTSFACTPNDSSGNPLKGECAAGGLACNSQAKVECKQTRFPLPEICDGLDNDCDGVPDNTAISWPNFKSDTDKLKSQNQSKYNQLYNQACRGEQTCACPTDLGLSNMRGAGLMSTNPQDLITHSDLWTSTHASCLCQTQ